MNSIEWVIQTNLLNMDRQNNVANVLRDLNIPFVGVNVIPFSDDLTFLSNEPTHTKVIPYGSTALVKRAEKRNWKGLFFNHNTFLVNQWIANRNDMLNSDADIMTVAQASQTFAAKSSNELFFIRPVADLKIFSGIVTTAGEIAKWMQSTDSGNFSFNEDTLVSVSQPKDILAEWRWFVIGGKIIDGSMYRARYQSYREHETDAAVIAEAQSLADSWLPHETCVMDVALTNNGPRVIEFNCFNGSGFYEHDVHKILATATQYFKESYE